MWYPSYKSRRKRALSNIMTSPFRGRQINKRNIRQYIIHSALPNIQKLLINISINFQTMSDAWIRLKNEIPPGRFPIPLHTDGSNNMRWVLVAISAIFSTFRNFRQNIGKTPSESFAGRQICIFASIQFTDTVQNETNFYIQWKYFKPGTVLVQNSV